MPSTRLFVLLIFGLAAGCAIAYSVMAAFDGGRDQVKKAAPRYEAFKPSAARIEDCTEVRECRQAWGNYAYKTDATTALRRLRTETGSGANGSDCHGFAHLIGQAMVAKLGDPGQAMLVGDETCNSGYYHGIIERSFVGLSPEQIGDRAKLMCSSEKMRRSPAAIQACLHAVGHGVLAYLAHDLPTALSICERFESIDLNDGCSSGAFMENIATAKEPHRPWLRDNDYTYPCGVVGEQHREACYVQMIPRATQAGVSWKAMFGLCKKIDQRHYRRCLEGIGNAMPRAIPARETVRMCGLGGRASQAPCLLGTLGSIVNNFNNGRHAARICKVPSALAPRDCFASIGYALNLLNPNPAHVQKQCREITKTYLAACVDPASGGGAS